MKQKSTAGKTSEPGTRTESPSANAFDRRAQFEAKRRALLQEAGSVFGQRGFGNTSLGEIAQKLNITKAALYYYFKSKHEILYECYAASFDLGDQAIDRALADGDTPREQLRLFIRHYTLAGLRDLHQTMALRDIDVLSPEHRTIIDGRRRNLHKRLRGVIEAGILEGSIGPCDPRVLMLTITGSISWVFRSFKPDGRLSAEQFADELVNVLANGFVTRPAGK